MTETAEPIIEVEDLVVKYGDRTVLDGVNFTVRRGEIFVILGGSGSGKTTLIRNLVGLMRPFSGRILVKGEDFTAMTDDERVAMRRKIGMSFQGSALFNSMTVGENVALPLREHTNLEPSTIEIMTKIKLELVGLAGFEDYMPSEFSGGMKKRAGIARAMAMDPEIIFYDEPSAGLDPIVAAGIDALIRKLQATYDLTSVVVTHEMESVKLIADTVCVLQKGRVVAIGPLERFSDRNIPIFNSSSPAVPTMKAAGEADYARYLTGLE